MNYNCLKDYFSFDPNKLALLNTKYTLLSEDEQVKLALLSLILLKHIAIDVVDELSSGWDYRTIHWIHLPFNTFNP